ncbi:MAG TPA: hypothetical protein VGA99_07205 [bacterium]
MKNHAFLNAAIGMLLLALLWDHGYSQQSRSIKDKLVITDSTQVQVLETTDGSTLIGRIVEVGENEIQFESQIGRTTIFISNIKDIRQQPLSSMRQGEYWFPNPNATRLYIAPTGRMLKAGDGYFTDVYLFFGGFSYGLTDQLTMGGGLSLFPGVPIDKQLWFLTPKMGVALKENLSIAVGALIIAIPDIDDDIDSPLVGGVYGVGTYGSLDNNLTLGIGYGFADGDFAEKPVLIVGVQTRLARRLSFVSENWILPGVDAEDPFVSYGLRFFGEKISIDLAFINSLTDGIFPGIPYIDFVFNF